MHNNIIMIHVYIKLYAHTILYMSCVHVIHTRTVNCGMPLDTSTVHVAYNSTLIDSVLQFRCKEGFSPTDVFTATCLENGRWSPDPAEHTCAASSGILNL